MIDDLRLRTELNGKLSKVRQLLDEKGLDAMLLQRVSSIAWAACGADVHINTAASNGNAALVITPDEKFVFTDNIEASRLEKEEGFSEQGWEFKVSPWYDSGKQLSAFLKGRKLGTDGLYLDGMDLTSELAWLRSQLTEDEADRFRKLSRWCAESMQEAARAIHPGMSEYEIAGLLSQATESRGVQAIVNLIATDERILAYRHPLPTAKELQHYAMLVLCGRKWGLICSITRLVHFGMLPDEIRKKSIAAAHVDAVMISATRPGNTMQDVFRQAQAAYEENGFPGEWQKHHQGGLAGYETREITVTPETRRTILANQAFAWNPSIKGAKSEDTILVGRENNEIMTETPGWPMIEVQLDGELIKRPAILEKN